MIRTGKKVSSFPSFFGLLLTAMAQSRFSQSLGSLSENILFWGAGMIIYLMAFRLLDPSDARKVAKIWPSVGRWSTGVGSPCVPTGSLCSHITTWTGDLAVNPSVILFLSFNQSPLGGRHSHSAVKNCHLNKDNLDGQVNPSRGSGIVWIPPTITLDAPKMGEVFPLGFLCYPFPGSLCK